MRVELSQQEWQQVMQLIAEGPWRVSNPLLMKIGQQLHTGEHNAPPINPSTGNAKSIDDMEEGHG